MTLTELRYITAVARERHFGRAAEACFVSQSTLSVAVRKLEDELGVMLFECNAAEVSVTPAWRKTFPRPQVIDVLKLAVARCPLQFQLRQMAGSGRQGMNV